MSESANEIMEIVILNLNTTKMKTKMKNRLDFASQKTKKWIFLLASSVILIGCTKDSTAPGANDEYPPVNIVDSQGSWWKYEWYETDLSGVPTSIGIVDSFYVIGDTVINGNTFVHIGGDAAFYGGASNPHQFLRDSANCILNSQGIIVYSNQTSLDTSLIYNMGPLTGYMLTGANPLSYSVPAGTFTNVLENQTHIYMTDGSDFACCNQWIQRRIYAE